MSGAAGPQWAPVVDETDDSVTARSAAALHQLLDAPGSVPVAGDPLPPLWHWLAFLPTAAQRELGSDGHPGRGGFLPPVTLPRRMFAGGHLEFSGRARIGEILHRRAVVQKVTEKQGRSGPLVFVEVVYRFGTGAVDEIRETQDLVYREDGPSGPQEPHPDPRLDEADWDWQHELAITPTLLFRFSALTYNAHRIHYDREYATGVEHHPGLVVHGPLQAVALAELCRTGLPDRRMCSYRFRALRPAYDGNPLRLRGRFTGPDTVELQAYDHTGTATMHATAEFAPRP